MAPLVCDVALDLPYLIGTKPASDLSFSRAGVSLVAWPEQLGCTL